MSDPLLENGYAHSAPHLHKQAEWPGLLENHYSMERIIFAGIPTAITFGGKERVTKPMATTTVLLKIYRCEDTKN